MQADNEALTQQLASERERSSAAIATVEERAGAARADLAAEQARTTQAIAAFSALAEQLEAIAEARRPWWRRLVG